MGAGVDQVLRDPELPRHLPVIRTVGPDLTQRMREYVLLQVLRFHRRLPEIEDALRRRAWAQIITTTEQRRPVGVLGLGNLGADAARQLADRRRAGEGKGVAVRGVHGGSGDI